MTKTPRNVLVVVARGLQLGAIGCYGNGWIDTPALDRLASEGVVFDQHFADAASPEGARAAWRSGLYNLPATAAPPGKETHDLLERLTVHGVPCCLITDARRPLPPSFVHGWSEVHLATPTEDDTPLEATLAVAEKRLKQGLGDSGFLLWVEFANLLPPWETPMDFQEPYFSNEPLEEDDEEGPIDEDEEEEDPLTPLEDPEPGLVDPEDDDFYLRLQTTHGAAVTYLDAGLAQLLETLNDLEMADKTLVIVLSDSGQALAEHGVIGPIRPWLHEEIVHLPLLIRLPGHIEGGRRVAALTQAVDLAPTLADFFGLAPLPCHGQSLVPLWRGEMDHVRDYICAGLQVGEGIEWCLRTPDWAFLLPVQPLPDDPTRTPHLYVKPDDRWEVNNVVQHHLDWSEVLEQTLRAFVAATRQPGSFQPPPLPEEFETDEPDEERK
jgi:arylsulfatase A-like enzyme